ncbi:MAG: cation:proton antiporter [Anaerolineaceae bacterium]
MNEVPLLINITLALVVAFIGGVIARRIGLPNIVGYLLAGIAIGPFTPGFVGDTETIQQLAELGVIFLMLGVGLNFSFADLWRVRDIAIPGSLIQTFISTLLGFGLSQLWGWSATAGIVLGLSISVASTVVLLRGLMDNSLLNTSHGQAAVGWLVMEDILSVLILVLMPILAPSSGAFDWKYLIITLLKAAAFITIMFFVGSRFIPWLLERIAHTRSRELFILAILAITLGTAMGAAELFGVSLALGAFAAGAIISQSRLSHQVGADVFSFRETFSILFFVSVGMLVNPSFLWQNLEQVISLTLLVVIGKPIIVILLGLLFPRPAKTFLVIAVGLSQIGEFSFILGQGGMSLNLLDSNQYSLILATALISITANPFMYRLLPILEKILRRFPRVWERLETNVPLPEIKENQLENHVIIIGYGRVGKDLVNLLQKLSISLLVIEADPEKIAILNERHIPTLFGDAGNSEILVHAHLEKARVLVTTISDETNTTMIITSARDLNPNLPIIARAATEQGVRNLAKIGANHIVQPELEGGLELIHHTLLCLGFPLREVHQYIEAIRRENYDMDTILDNEHHSLHDLLRAVKGVEIVWFKLDDTCSLIGKSLAEANIRSKTGASVVALIRDKQLIANPKSMIVFKSGDCIGVIGESDQIEAVQRLITS